MTTELEAVNTLLSTISAAPLSNLSAIPTQEGMLAHLTLREATRNMQVRGWHWNSDYGRKLLADSEGRFNLPAGTLFVDTVGNDAHIDVVQRGGYLYDTRNHTTRFPGKPSITVDLVTHLPWNDLPEIAKWYAIVSGARLFQQRAIGSETLSHFTQMDEALALAHLRNYDNRVADRKVLQSPVARSVLGGRR